MKKDGSYHWETVKSVLLREFAQETARSFSDGYWIHPEIQKSYVRAVQGHTGDITMRPEMMEYTLIPHNWKEYIIHMGISWNSQSILGSGIIPGG